MTAILPRSGGAPAPLIYVIEDDAAIAKLVVTALHEFGFATEAFGNGATVLRRLRTERPDLCIVDLGLPDMDGIELVRAIAELSTAASTCASRACAARLRATRRTPRSSRRCMVPGTCSRLQ